MTSGRGEMLPWGSCAQTCRMAEASLSPGKVGKWFWGALKVKGTWQLLVLHSQGPGEIECFRIC